MTLADDLKSLRVVVEDMPSTQCGDPACIACKRQIESKRAAQDALARIADALPKETK